MKERDESVGLLCAGGPKDGEQYAVRGKLNEKIAVKYEPPLQGTPEALEAYDKSGGIGYYTLSTIGCESAGLLYYALVWEDATKQDIARAVLTLLKEGS